MKSFIFFKRLFRFERAKDGVWTTTERYKHVRTHFFTIDRVEEFGSMQTAICIIVGPWKIVWAKIR
jgi:hypothetical protein